MTQRESVMRALALIVGMVLVATAHVLLGYLLYRNRVVNKSELGDGLVFLLPWAAAAVAYGGLFWWSGYLASKRRMRWLTTIAIALAAASISFLEMFTICANEFGT